MLAEGARARFNDEPLRDRMDAAREREPEESEEDAEGVLTSATVIVRISIARLDKSIRTQSRSLTHDLAPGLRQHHGRP